MATTTPNYGWTVPTSTDLVKDGATAIETLGDSVDATVKALNPETTLGDIAYRSATANTNTRLPIGTSGQVLTVNGSGVPAWATSSSGGMTLLSTTTLTGTSVVVSSIDQTYNYLQVFITGIDFAAVDHMIIRPNSATTNLNNAVISTASATAVTSTTRWNPSQGRNVKDTSNEGVVILNIYNYASTTAWKTANWNSAFFDDASSTNTAYFGYGIWSTSNAITSLQFRTDSGTNAFDGGTIKIYGVK